VSESSFFPSPAGLRFSLRIVIAVGVLLLSGMRSLAQTPGDAVRGLARRAAEVREMPQAVAVEWSNASSLPDAESIILREAFLQEFARRHSVSPAPSTAAPASSVLHVSVRETPTAFLVLAQVPAATGVQVHMVELARAAFLSVVARGNGLRLTRQLLWRQGEPVLDAREFAAGGANGVLVGAEQSAANIFLLRTDAVAIYREDDERLTELQELAFPGYHYASRGLRGEIVKDNDGDLAVVLPGLRCALHGSPAAGQRWTMSCATSGDAASAAHSDAQSVPLAAGCQPGSWELVSAATDWTQPDRLLLRSAAMKGEEAVASVDFSGPIVRLTATEDGRSALAVVFDLASGSYDVYRVSMVCGR
jgi:hypothetical protein